MTVIMSLGRKKTKDSSWLICKVKVIIVYIASSRFLRVTDGKSIYLDIYCVLLIPA